MTSSLEDYILDNGLAKLDSESAILWICKDDPTSIAIAATSGLLGFKSFTVGSLFAAPSAGAAPTGRRVTSAVISDGTVTTSGTAAFWAVGATGTLHAHGSLSATQVVAAGNTFTLGAFDIKIPNAGA